MAFRAVNFFNADDVGTKICQENVQAAIAPKVQYPDAF